MIESRCYAAKLLHKFDHTMKGAEREMHARYCHDSSLTQATQVMPKSNGSNSPKNVPAQTNAQAHKPVKMREAESSTL